MSQKIIDNLKTLGLTENEAEVYAALIKLGPCFVAPLIQETHKHRQMVYNALEALLKRGLVMRSMQDGKQIYELSNPERLMAILEAQELVARETIEQIKDQVKSSEEQVETFRGLEGYKTAVMELADSLLETGDYLVFNSFPREYSAITASFKGIFLEKLRRAQAQGGTLNILLFPNNKQDALAENLGNQFLGDAFTTRVVTAHPEPPQTIWVSGNNVYLRNRLGDPLMIHITSSDLAERYRKYFYTLWEGAEPLVRE